MRMTDRVLNASALSSGLAVNNVSLVNQLGKNRQDSLLDALEKGSGASTRKKENYSKLRKAAEQLAQRTEELAKEGEDSIFARAKASGDREELSQSLQEFAKNYNDTLKRLRGTGAPLDVYYSQMLQGAAKDNSKALAGVGITFGRDGSMQIAKEALEKADLEELENLFGASGSFSSKVTFLAGRISGNAQANEASSSSQYDASGHSYAAYSNLYDNWG